MPSQRSWWWSTHSADRVDAEALEHAEADLRVALQHQALGVGERAGLAQDLLRDRELAEVVQAARQPCQLDLLLVEPDALGQPRGEVGDPAGVAAGVGVAEVDRFGQARRGAVARCAIGAVGEAAELGELDDVRTVEVHAVPSVLLGPVQRAVGQADQLVAIERLLGEARDAGADGDRADEVELELADALDDRARDRERLARVVVGEQQRELVAAEPEGLAVLAQLRRQLGEQAVALGMPEQVVDPLEVVDVEQAEREGRSAGFRLHQLALEALVEVAVVPEPGERVGQCKTHRAQSVVGRALVQRDGEQRTRRAPPREAATAARGRRA